MKIVLVVATNNIEDLVESNFLLPHCNGVLPHAV